MRTAAAELVPGTILCERYEVLSAIGHGGMGVVYAGRHLRLGHRVAVKVIGNVQTETLKSRFMREAQLASRVQHPHTVYVTDFGQLPDGGLFLVMELLSGQTLAAVLAESGRMEPLRVCKIGAMIASGMQSVHEQGIVHRDLKPSNIILLDHHGTRDYVKILDFGVAKEMVAQGRGDSTVDETPELGRNGRETEPDESQSRAALTRTGGMMGTPRYMAPEQLRGEVVDARADQYALGCTLYEMLTGRPPHLGDVRAMTLGHLYGDLERPRRLRSGISPALEEIVLRALMRRREGRFADMRTLAAALQAEAERLERRRPLATLPGSYAAGVAVLGMAVTVGALYVHNMKRAPSQPHKTVEKKIELPSISETRQRTPPLASPPAPSPTPAQPIPRVAPAVLTPSEQPPAVATLGQLLARASAALLRHDNRIAQQLFTSIRRRCASDRPIPTECELAVPQAALSLGRIHEAEGQLPEALSEYTRALASASASASRAPQLKLRQEAHEATARLLPQLGRVVLVRTHEGRCEEVPMFLLPGEHQIELNGERLLVSIKARETRRIGSCEPR